MVSACSWGSVCRCILSTAARQLRAQQPAPVVADRVIEMSAACCDGNADVTCRDGSPPRDCGSVCAVFFHSFFNDCGVLLQTVMAAQIDEFTAFDATCLASADVEFFLSAIQHTTCCITSCKQQLERVSDSASGVYTMCGRDGADDYDVYCDMETDGGGWTMVMNINPVDDNLVGYGQDFWTGEHEYGEWDHHFANDYKSPAAYQLNGPDRYNADVPTAEDGEIMIQSVAYPDRETDAAFEDTEIRGWRTWPMLASYPTFQSMFSTECCHGDNCGNGNHPCKTGSPSGQEVGSTDEWDDIIRRGNCLRTDLRYGSSSGGEAFRLMTYDPVSTNDRMGGFGGATNSGNNLCDSQGIFGQRDNSGMDRILCNQDRQNGCGHGESRVMRNPVTGAREPCQQSPSPEYCTTSSPYHYNDPNSFRPGWTSRFFVREPTALTPQMIAAMEACESANRYWDRDAQECTDGIVCDAGWTRFETNDGSLSPACYKIGSNGNNDACVNYCQTQQGARLAAPRSADEDYFIVGMCRQTGTNCWLGLRCDGTGELNGYRNYRGSECGSRNHNTCGGLYTGFYSDYRPGVQFWDDDGCGGGRQCICQLL
jgi:hypothetical protein